MKNIKKPKEFEKHMEDNRRIIILTDLSGTIFDK